MFTTVLMDQLLCAKIKKINKLRAVPWQEDTISPFSPVSLQQMISLFSFISSPPKMVIDLGQREAEGEID